MMERRRNQQAFGEEKKTGGDRQRCRERSDEKKKPVSVSRIA
jgi:hypothetical protein